MISQARTYPNFADTLYEVFTGDMMFATYGTRDISVERDPFSLQTFVIVDGTPRRLSARVWAMLNSPDPVVVHEAWKEFHQMVLEMTIVQRGAAELGFYSFWA